MLSMELKLKFETKVPTEEGQYMVYFPNTHTFDFVTLVFKQYTIGEGRFLCAVGRGGNIDRWHCVWSQRLAHF